MHWHTTMKQKKCLDFQILLGDRRGSEFFDWHCKFNISFEKLLNFQKFISFCEPDVMTYDYKFYPMTISIICPEYTVILFFRIDEIWKKIKSYFNTAACYSTFSPSTGYKQSNWKKPFCPRLLLQVQVHFMHLVSTG